MERNATQKTRGTDQKTTSTAFSPVFDSKKRKVKGLQVRNGKYYARVVVVSLDGKKAVRVPLAATRLDEAKKEAENIRTDQRRGKAPSVGHKPTFAELAKQFQESADFLARADKKNAERVLAMWVHAFGQYRIDRIRRADILQYIDERRKSTARGGVNRGTVVLPQTINKELVVYRQAVKFGLEREMFGDFVPYLPKNIDCDDPEEKRNLTRDELTLLLKACNAKVTKNHAQMAFLIRFLATSGARIAQALKTRWEDVDFDKGIVHVTPAKKGRFKKDSKPDVYFNPALREVLEEMRDCRPPDTQWLFPSPQRGEKDIPATSLKDSFNKVRKSAGLEWVGFHHFRHYFASQCVMGGVDFKTTAKWLGHRDGGQLVAKTYSHLTEDHQRDAAMKLAL